MLGAILFTLYGKPGKYVYGNFGIIDHFYADDNQFTTALLLITFRRTNSPGEVTFKMLKLNGDNTESILIAPDRRQHKINVSDITADGNKI